MNEEKETSAGDFSGTENMDSALDVISDAVSNVPAPIRKNAIKAFSQLCTAAIDIPVAHFEGIAAEKRAETQARIKIINTEAKQISQQMDVDPEFARVAVKKYGEKIVREQVNLDVIAENAAQELMRGPLKESDDKNEASVDEEISQDWLNHFENEALNKSSDEMRLLFGKILAGEIHKPSSYSIKTVKIISQLDTQAAKLFQICCSLCVSLHVDNQVFDARVASLGGNANSNSLQNYDLSFDNLNILEEYGLIISDYNSSMPYRRYVTNKNGLVQSAFAYQSKSFVLVPNEEQGQHSEFKLHGVALSKSGKELLNVIDILPVEEYTKALKAYFLNNKLQMIEIKQSRSETKKA